MTSIRALCSISALLWLAWPCHSVLADPISVLDVKIEIRVLDFLLDPDHRDRIAVIYDRDNAESRREADFTLRTLQEFAALSHRHFLAELLDKTALPGAKAYAALLLGPATTEAEVDALRYGVTHHALVLSAGRDCVRRANCAVGVTSLPEVEIALSPAVVRKCGIRFADGFQLMVKEY